MLPDAVLHSGVLIDALLFAVCLTILVLGVWIARNPAAFWDQFNPFLKPYNRFTLGLGRVIGSLWTMGAACGCILFVGNAIEAGLHHRWFL